MRTPIMGLAAAFLFSACNTYNPDYVREHQDTVEHEYLYYKSMYLHDGVPSAHEGNVCHDRIKLDDGSYRILHVKCPRPLGPPSPDSRDVASSTYCVGEMAGQRRLSQPGPATGRRDRRFCVRRGRSASSRPTWGCGRHTETTGRRRAIVNGKKTNRHRGPWSRRRASAALAAVPVLIVLAVLPAAAEESADGADARRGSPAASFAAHEPLPEGGPAELAALYYGADEVPGVASLGADHRRSLLDVVTRRYKDRLADRGAGPEGTMRAHLERLAGSRLAADRPMVMAQSCARFGIDDGVCAAHRGYVRRARLLEEMLATGRTTLAALETDLVGAPRRGLDAAGNAD